MAKGMNRKDSSRVCFGSTDAGKRTLGLILIDAGYFDTDLKTPEEQAVLNFAKKIISNLGIGNSPQSVMEFVNKLFELPSE